MNTATTILLTALSVIVCNGQTWDEWFQQKKTQKKYLVDQIAALRMYSEYLKKGYQVVHTGLTTIEQIKGGNFSLDQAFFNARKIPNPAIRNSAMVLGIAGYYIMSVRDFRRLYAFAKQDDNFSSDEILYIGHVFANLIRMCDASLLELRDVTGDNTMEMTDDERVKKVGTLYAEAQSTYSFVQAFGNDTRLLAHQRQRELLDTRISSQLH